MRQTAACLFRKVTVTPQAINNLFVLLEKKGGTEGEDIFCIWIFVVYVL